MSDAGASRWREWTRTGDGLHWDFMPDLLTMQERPPSRLPRAVGWLICMTVGLSLLWAGFAQLDVVVVADGRLVPQSLAKPIQATDAGVVRELLVREGELVAAGQPLFRLDPRAAEADRAALARDRMYKRMALTRIAAELGESSQFSLEALLSSDKSHPTVYDVGEVWRRNAAEQVFAQYAAHRRAQLDALTQEQDNLRRALADLRSAQQVLEKLKQTVPSYVQSAQAFAQLKLEGFVGELAANEKGRDAVERQHDLRAQEATVESLSAIARQVRGRIASTESAYRASLQNERMELEGQLGKAEQELQKTAVRGDYLEVRAPQAGVVQDLQVTASGAVVQVGSVLLTLVPRSEPFMAEVWVNNADAGLVSAGQPARLKLAAYPFQRHGLLEATITQVSVDVANDRRPDSADARRDLRYKANVAVSDEAARRFGQRLQPGMLVSAEINQGQRTALEYLLSSIRTVTHDAAREP